MMTALHRMLPCTIVSVIQPLQHTFWILLLSLSSNLAPRECGVQSSSGHPGPWVFQEGIKHIQSPHHSVDEPALLTAHGA